MKRQFLLYVIALFALDAIVLYIIGSGLNNYLMSLGLFLTSSRGYDYIDGVFLSVILISTSTTFKLFQQWVISMERISELMQISYKHELNALRNQINPHFLFNMLNNINHLVRTRPEQANEVISKLSGFLRHQIYRTDDELVQLSSEIEFLENFLDLEKIRRDHFSITTQISNLDKDQRAIDAIFLPANLFTTFVENAVKHSVSLSDAETFIRLDFIIHSKTLEFICTNSKDNEYAVESKDSGVGLATMRKRLDLIYAKDYQLTIDNREEEFVVKLILPV